MKESKLLPFNGTIIKTSDLKELEYSTKDINVMLDNGILTRTKRGYYQVSIKGEVDTNLMKYYLSNKLYEEFLEYFNSLLVKDYNAYYYKFIYDIQKENYSEAYTTLFKCCELNKDKNNKVNLYAYVLLLSELMSLPTEKILAIKNKIFKVSDDYLKLFLECIINKDYDNACKNLRNGKENMSKLELNLLRNLSIKALACYQKKNSPEIIEYNNLYQNFYNSILSDDYEVAIYYFNKLYNLGLNLNINDTSIEIINILFKCFDYIVEHQDVDLSTYKTNYKYDGETINNFYLAIKRNDFVKALEFISLITNKDNNNDKFYVYRKLLERIYNFLNIRTIIKKKSPRKLTLTSLIKDKRYDEALKVANESSLDNHNKNIVTSLLESLVAIDDNSLFSKES